jgi:hypothetical protein
MRVKLLIALAIASIFLLAAVLPAGAVEGKVGKSATEINVPSPRLVMPVIPSTVVPCVSFQAPTAPVANTITANTITLGGPALDTQITLAGPQTPSFSSPNFELQKLFPPFITPFEATNPYFDP